MESASDRDELALAGTSPQNLLDPSGSKTNISTVRNVDQYQYQQQRQRQELRRSRARYRRNSSAVADDTIVPSSSMTAGVTFSHVDRQPPSHHQEQKQDDSSPKDCLRSSRHGTRRRSGRDRPDPPVCSDPLRHSHRNHLSNKAKHSSTPRQTPEQRDRTNLNASAHQRRANKASRDQSSSRKHRHGHQQGHRERQPSQSAREPSTKKQGRSSSRPWKSEKSSLAESRRRRAEDLDGVHCHPAKSSSFEEDPRQLLQVYKDLRQRQLGLNSNRRIKDPINEANLDSDSIGARSLKSNHRTEFPSNDKSPGMNSFNEKQDQLPIKQDCEIDSFDGSDVNSLTVLDDDSDFRERGTYQYGESTNSPRAISPSRPKKDNFKSTVFDRKGSTDGGTSITTASTTPEVAAVATKDLAAQFQLKQQHCVAIPVDRYDDEDNMRDEAAAIVHAAASFPIKAKEESSDQGIIRHLHQSIGGNRENSIDKQLLQKQIKYLQNEPSSIKNNQESPLIIYPCHERSTGRDASVNEIWKEVRRRRDIVYNRDGKKKNDHSMGHGDGRRWSFS